MASNSAMLAKFNRENRCCMAEWIPDTVIQGRGSTARPRVVRGHFSEFKSVCGQEIENRVLQRNWASVTCQDCINEDALRTVHLT